MSGAKIIAGLKEAIAGDLARVTIDGQTWVRADDLLADQQEIMRINNMLRTLGNELCNAACDIHPTAPSSASVDRLHQAIVAWSDAASV